MANKIQFRRGLKANLPTLSMAEPAFTTDTNDLYIGNGTTNVQIGKKSEIGDLATLTTTDKTTLVIAINEVNAKPSGGGTAESTTYDNTTSGLTATNVQDAIDEVDTKIIYNASQKEGIIFDIGSTITSDFYNDGGWVNNLSPTTTKSIMYYNKSTSSDKWIAKVEITLRDSVTSTKLVMCNKTQPNHIGLMMYVIFDLANKKIQICQGWDGNLSTDPSVLVEGTITFDPVQNGTYILQIERDTIDRLVATIYDKNSLGSTTLTKFSVEHRISTDGVSHGGGIDGIGLIHIAGSYYRNRFTQIVNQNIKPILAIYSDSYGECYGLIPYGIKNTFSNLIKSSLSGNLALSARGGETTGETLNKATTDFTIFKPKYTLIMLGLNDALNSVTFAQYQTNILSIIDLVIANNSIPIISTLPFLNSLSVITQINSWVKSSGYRYVDLNAALSNSDGSMNTSLLLADAVHPNIAGHKKIADKIKLDCNYIFNSDNSETTMMGAWYPTIVGKTTAGTQAYTTQNGIYSRMGDLVFVAGRIRLSSTSGCVGNLVISGLPFNAKNISIRQSVQINNVESLTGCTPMNLVYSYIGANTNEINLKNDSDFVTATSLTASTFMDFSCCYMAE